MSDRKAVIKNADMVEDMQQDAVDCATQALEKYNIEKDIAGYIKKEFDKKYNPTWHCIVGRNFGSYVTHETKHFIYFYLGQVAILLFKSGWNYVGDGWEVEAIGSPFLSISFSVFLFRWAFRIFPRKSNCILRMRFSFDFITFIFYFRRKEGSLVLESAQISTNYFVNFLD